MPIEPKIPKQAFLTKKCNKCNGVFSIEEFAPTHSPFYPDGYIPFCNNCARSYLEENEWNWEAVDKLCQYAGIPFIVKEWDRLFELNGKNDVWSVYSKVFANDSYKSLGWTDYFHQYQKLKEASLIEDEIPLLKEERLARLHKTWGNNYDEDDLMYLEDLYKGLLVGQNVNGAL